MTLAEKAAAAAAVVLHLVFGVFPFAASGLVTPLWGIVVLYGWWLALAVLVVRSLRAPPNRRPFVALAVPFVALAGWFAFVSLGSVLLGWTA